MGNNFTLEMADDIIEKSYQTWEEIPVATLSFNSETSQTCYITMSKDKAVEACNVKAIPKNTIAYEYKENITKLKKDEVILAIDLDTTNMLDLTNRAEYIRYLNDKINKGRYDIDVPLIRRIELDRSLNHTYVCYIIKDNRCVRDIQKFYK